MKNALHLQRMFDHYMAAWKQCTDLGDKATDKDIFMAEFFCKLCDVILKTEEEYLKRFGSEALTEQVKALESALKHPILVANGKQQKPTGA